MEYNNQESAAVMYFWAINPEPRTGNLACPAKPGGRRREPKKKNRAVREAEALFSFCL
jgi:hypothetical protein